MKLKHYQGQSWGHEELWGAYGAGVPTSEQHALAAALSGDCVAVFMRQFRVVRDPDSLRAAMRYDACRQMAYRKLIRHSLRGV
jgi:hypothetical protein